MNKLSKKEETCDERKKERKKEKNKLTKKNE